MITRKSNRILPDASDPIESEKLRLKKRLWSSQKTEAADALLDICFTVDDPEWIQDICIGLIRNHAEIDIRKLALTCFGHVARKHQTINQEKVFPVLAEMLRDEKMSGSALEAINDIQKFLEIDWGPRVTEGGEQRP